MKIKGMFSGWEFNAGYIISPDEKYTLRINYAGRLIGDADKTQTLMTGLSLINKLRMKIEYKREVRRRLEKYIEEQKINKLKE